MKKTPPPTHVHEAGAKQCDCSVARYNSRTPGLFPVSLGRAQYGMRSDSDHISSRIGACPSPSIDPPARDKMRFMAILMGIKLCAAFLSMAESADMGEYQGRAKRFAAENIQKANHIACLHAIVWRSARPLFQPVRLCRWRDMQAVFDHRDVKRAFLCPVSHRMDNRRAGRRAATAPFSPRSAQLTTTTRGSSARILLLTSSSRPARLLFDKRGGVELQGHGLCKCLCSWGNKVPKRAGGPCSSLGCADLPARLSMLGLERVIVGVCVPE